jgi:hypothetical protein
VTETCIRLKIDGAFPIPPLSIHDCTEYRMIKESDWNAVVASSAAG